MATNPEISPPSGSAYTFGFFTLAASEYILKKNNPDMPASARSMVSMGTIYSSPLLLQGASWVLELGKSLRAPSGEILTTLRNALSKPVLNWENISATHEKISKGLPSMMVLGMIPDHLIDATGKILEKLGIKSGEYIQSGTFGHFALTMAAGFYMHYKISNSVRLAPLLTGQGSGLVGIAGKALRILGGALMVNMSADATEWALYKIAGQSEDPHHLLHIEARNQLVLKRYESIFGKTAAPYVCGPTHMLGAFGVTLERLAKLTVGNHSVDEEYEKYKEDIISETESFGRSMEVFIAQLIVQSSKEKGSINWTEVETQVKNYYQQNATDIRKQYERIEKLGSHPFLKQGYASALQNHIQVNGSMSGHESLLKLVSRALRGEIGHLQDQLVDEYIQSKIGTPTKYKYNGNSIMPEIAEMNINPNIASYTPSQKEAVKNIAQVAQRQIELKNTLEELEKLAPPTS